MSASGSEAIPHVESPEELDKHLKEAEDKLVILMFYAHWCGPSTYIEPIFEELRDNNKDCIFLRINTNKAEKLTDRMDVNLIPTFLFYRNNTKVDELVGANEYILKEQFEKNKN